MSRVVFVDMATGLRAGGAEESAFSSRQGWGTKSLFLRPRCIGPGRARTQNTNHSFPAGVKRFSLFQSVRTVSGFRPASCPVGTEVHVSGVKPAGP